MFLLNNKGLWEQSHYKAFQQGRSSQIFCPVKAYLTEAVEEAGSRDYIATSASVPFCFPKQQLPSYRHVPGSFSQFSHPS